MIFYGPNFKNGKVIDELVSLIDIPPTPSSGIHDPPYELMWFDQELKAEMGYK